jgi:serine/threonine protein kinase/Tfp pilus assembly protein PilF
MGQPRQSAERLFTDALELEPAARQTFLDRACRGDPSLRRLVEELLREDERAGSFLRWPIVTSRPDAAAAATISNIDRDRPAEATARFRAGETIARRFHVVRFIARGGMGEVYEVEDCLLQGNRVALKMIRPEIAAHEESSRRFEQEVLLARNINHPNLCPIYEIFRCDDEPPPFLFLTMKLLTGETLESSLRKHVLLQSDEALEIFRQMIAGIAAIHDAGIVHRDIKPTNVMLDRSGLHLSVSIMDFGLAQHHESDATLAGIGTIAGTPGYLAPELIRGHRPSRASDIYALGVLLHQVLTGERPVESADGLALHAAPSLDTIGTPAIYTRTVREFLSEDPVARCRAFEQFRSFIAGGSLQPPRHSPRTWTRRQMLAASGAACCLVAGGAFWKRDTVADYLNPLPLKRFVALLGWPPSADAKIKPVLMGLIDSISSELARAEAYDHNLFLIPAFSSEVATPAQMDEVRESLGANLVLATSGVRSPKDLHVSLQVLSPSSSRALRTKHIRVAESEELSLAQKAVRAAAELLDIRHYEPSDKRVAPGTSSPEAFAAFQAAESLRKLNNDLGLEAAIEKYKEAIELDGHFALATASLAVAYCRLADVKHDPAATALARANAETALTMDPHLVPARIALAGALEQTGDEASALREMKRALAADPTNTRTLTWLGDSYVRLNRWQSAEESFRRALQLRPNDWITRNQFGIVLNAQGKYQQASSEFRAASLANPKFALALNNIASVCLQLGRVPEAIAKLDQSLALKPNAFALFNMSAALRYQGKPLSALGFARKATELEPGDSLSWLELGDCNSMIRGHETDARKAYEQAAQAQREALDTNATDGPGWIQLALFEAKTGANEQARAHIRIGDSFPSNDLDTQIYKARALEVLGSREEALNVLAECFRRGATPFQVDLAPDMADMRRDTRYQKLLQRS